MGWHSYIRYQKASAAPYRTTPLLLPRMVDELYSGIINHATRKNRGENGCIAFLSSSSKGKRAMEHSDAEYMNISIPTSAA